MKYLKQLSVAVVIFTSVVTWAQADRTEWFRAAATDDASVILRQLLRGTDPNVRDADGQPAIVLAARAESWNALDALLAAPGIQVDARNGNDETALMMAALRGNVEIAKRLMAKDADVNKPGWTPLHYAATGGNPAMVQLLLDRHAYIDAASPNGSTPLMMAAMYGSSESVKTLLAADADASLKNALGMTALDFAKQGQRPDAVQILSTWRPTTSVAPVASRAAASTPGLAARSASGKQAASASVLRTPNPVAAQMPSPIVSPNVSPTVSPTVSPNVRATAPSSATPSAQRGLAGGSSLSPLPANPSPLGAAAAGAASSAKPAASVPRGMW